MEEEGFCLDCGTDCQTGSSVDYAVLDEIWHQTGLTPDGGELCLGCPTACLHRPLTIGDLKSLHNSPVNAPMAGAQDLETFELLMLPWLEDSLRRPNHP